MRELLVVGAFVVDVSRIKKNKCHTGVAKGLACHAAHDLNFFKPKFF